MSTKIRERETALHEMTAGDGTPIAWNEVLVRRWRGDRVVSERFYQASAPR